MTAPDRADWSSWNPDTPPGCPPEIWARAVASARLIKTNPDQPRPLCRTDEEIFWQGRADGLILGDRVPDHLRDWLVGLLRPYLPPPAEDTPAA